MKKGSTVNWEGWQKKRMIGRRKVTRSLPPQQADQMFKAWHFAEQLGMPLNWFVTIRPRLIDQMTPAQRIQHFESCRNKLAQFARDNRFDHVIVWSRESTRNTGDAEHMHSIVHVPDKLLDRFDDTGNGWYGNTDEIDIRPATYKITITKTGRRHTAISYLAKNSPIAARGPKNFTFRLGGPILGKRAGWSRNIGAAAQARHEARHLIRGEFGQDRAIREDLR